uniref:Uncharacterized protein n=1 Tax=Rhizophora mucronata TaxID=61149 RepID=A0A2P2LB45_RHIMU
MARQANAFFLEEWLRSHSIGGSSSISTRNSSSAARAIIQAWADLRDSLQHQSFQSHHIQSLKILLDSQTSLHVADPQAKLLLSILSSRNLVLSHESYPLFLRLLYIWVRKSFRPSLSLIDSCVEVLSNLLGPQFSFRKSPEILSGGVILLGALSFVPSVSEFSITVCLDLLCKLLEEEYRICSSSDGLIPDILAGIGYGLSSSVNIHCARILDALLGIWGKEDRPRSSVSHGLMILHLVEWVISGFIKSRSQEKLQIFIKEGLETIKANYVPFAVVMAASGSLRALNRSTPNSQGLQIIFQLRISAENQMEFVARALTSKMKGFSTPDDDSSTGLLLNCICLALARAGSVSCRAPLLITLASALLTEVFPLQRIYRMILERQDATSGLVPQKVNEHISSIPFKEAGAISGVLCNQYASTDEENKAIVEKMVWHFCQELYFGHRQVAFLLRGREDEFLGNIEKIAESAFLMVVVFASSVTKHKLNSKISSDTQAETSISILVSFSCFEYFRRMRLPEYIDTIRCVVVTVQEKETECVSFVESMPSYTDLTKPQDFLPEMEYVWFKDEVQTARILFYLRVIPTCIERLPGPIFRRVVAQTMFLYMEHPSGIVAQASHSMFVAFLSVEKDLDNNERALLKEQLAFYYIQRSLAGYPGTTPFEGMASGVAALIRNLPAGSPATFYCIHSLVEKVNRLCTDTNTQKLDIWKNWQGESEPCKGILQLALQLISLVDIQVLPELMKLLAQQILQLPRDGQNVVLNDLYALVAESDDVTHKPTLVSWLQSLAYLSSKTSGSAASEGNGSKESLALSLVDPSNGDRMLARL